MKILAISGHRPEVNERVIAETTLKTIERLSGEFDTLITGIAHGTDIVATEVALSDSDWKVIAAIPYYGQEAKWTTAWKKRYWSCLSHLRTDARNITDGPWNKGALFKRNRYVVKKADKLIAFMSRENSGTGHTVRFAQERLPIGDVHIFNPDTGKWS